MPARSHTDDPAPVRPLAPPLPDANHLIAQLPRTIDTLPAFALTPPGAGQRWHLSITLAPQDQAALQALRPAAYALCAAAQHALGLAAIGSQIDPAHGTVTVRAAAAPQFDIVGAAALWWVANAPPSLLRAFLESLAAQVGRAAGDSPAAAGPTRRP